MRPADQTASSAPPAAFLAAARTAALAARLPAILAAQTILITVIALCAMLLAPPAGAAPAGPLAAVAARVEAATGASAPAPASEPLAQSLDQVIGTLQDDKQRAALVTQLRALRQGLAASAPAAAASDAAATPGLIGAVAEALDHLDTGLRKDHGPWHYWRWRMQFAGEEWRAALTANGTRPPGQALREFVTVLASWGVTGWILWEIARRLRERRLHPAQPAQLPAVPSWLDVGVYFLRRIGPWAVAFGLTMLLAFRVFAHSPGSIAGVLVAYAIVAGAVLSAVCQVIFALFASAHRAHAVRSLLWHSRKLLFCTGVLAALGDATTDGRIIAAFGINLSALVATFANIAAAILIGIFVLVFRRQVGQLIALRPLAFRQARPALVDVLRLAGESWYLPVLAVVVASVAGTVLATGHADVFLRRAVASVALFIAALLLTLVVGHSPKSATRAPRIRDRRRSAYVARFGRFAAALLRIAIWASFLELGARVWGTSAVELAESTRVGRHISEVIVSVMATVLLAWLLWLVIDTAITQTLTPSHGRAPAPSLRAKTILPLVRNASLVTLLVVTLIVVLANLGVNVTPLLAGAGVVGLAVGFGAQSLVQDLITGLFIVIEDSIAIGDSIELTDHAGVVEAMTIRTIRLRDGKGALHTLPYSQIKAVKNLSRGYAFAVFNIAIGYGSDLERALELIRTTGTEVSRDHRYARNLLSGLDILGLDRFDPNGVVVMAQFKTRPLKQAEVTRAFNARLKKHFDDNDIHMAAPLMTVRVDGASLAAGGGAQTSVPSAGSPTPGEPAED